MRNEKRDRVASVGTSIPTARSECAESGQIMVSMLLMLSIFLLAMVGFAVDLTNLWFHRQAAQTAADAACSAGAADMLTVAVGTALPNMGFTPGTPGDCTSGAGTICFYANVNGFNGAGLSPNSASNSVNWVFPSSIPGVTTPSTSLTSYPFLKVVITENVKTHFLYTIHGTSYQQVAASCSGAAGLMAFLVAYVFFPALLLDVLVGGVGLMAPILYLKQRRARRLVVFNNGLPDAIDLIARALRAGHSLSSAIEVLSEQSGGGVATEFNVVFRQQNFGLPLRDALLQMADRVPSKDLRFLVTAMLVQKETGGNLTEILDRTSHVIRERIRIGGEVRVRTAQGRLTGTILSLLPVLMLVLTSLINPEYARILLHDPVGQKLLYVGAALILTGTFFIRRIVDIQV
jgi:tight adherence protein B